MALNVVSAFGSLFNINLTCMSPGFYVWESSFNCEISNKLKLNPINKDCSRFRTFKVCIDAVAYCLPLKTCTNYIFYKNTGGLCLPVCLHTF